MKAKIDERLFELIPLHSELPHEQLFIAARYALTGGKRLRPLLALTCARAFGIPFEKCLDAACTLELIHTYSLIHDDLPSMDNDDMRRGRPSLHKAFPEGQAILVGDYLLTYSFEILATCPDLTPQQRIALIAELAKGSGSEGMIGGQVIDLATQNQSLNESELLSIDTKKTAALMATSLVFGGILAKASLEEIESLRSIGASLGIAFQLADDLADGKGATQHLPLNRIEQLIEFHLTHAFKQLETLHADTQELHRFFKAIFYEQSTH